ncbi:MAG: tRNA lysidine(34) synthetase TilS [Bifidobacteriales bacterium]|nr:tRNA lysidine(34) synthetase TilS [Bifidobacteriales bacterium]
MREHLAIKAGVGTSPPHLIQAGEAEPLTEVEFRALMALVEPIGPDEAGHPVCIAVSGGGDSMALALLARRWRRHVLALVVDHALREESAAEARLTCERLVALDIPARLLTLGPLAAGGLQQRAREGRFAALEAACVDAGATVLLVAHHEADQEETLWMRHERGSGTRGLAGMAHRAARGRIIVARPLLGVRPERLRATLQQAGVAWCEDPSNQNRRFRRVQVRQDITSAQRRMMRELQQKACIAQQEDDAWVARFLAHGVAWQPEGWLKLAPFLIQTAHERPHIFIDDGLDETRFVALCDEVMGRLIRLIGGQDYAPTRHAVAALRRAGHGALGRACLTPLKGQERGWMLYREARNLAGAMPAHTGQWWDGRWRYYGPEYSDVVIAALGMHATRWREGRDVPACILPSLPALWRGEELVAVPEAMRGLRSDVPRVAFVWEGGIPVTGERDWQSGYAE